MRRFAAIGVLAALQAFCQVIPTINSKGGAMTVPEGKLLFGMKHIYFKRDSMFDGRSEVPNKEGLRAHANFTKLILRYGVSKDFDIRFVLPYKQVRATAQLGPHRVHIANKGLSDIAVVGKYVFWRSSGAQAAFEAGVRLPSGATDRHFKEAPPFAKKSTTPLPTQPGSGAREYIVGVGYSKAFARFRIDAHTMYRYRTKGKHNYDFGDELSFDLGGVYGLASWFNVGLEYNFIYNSKTDMGDDTTPQLRAKLPFKALSGSVGFLTPQIELLPFGKPKVHLSLGVSFLVHYNLKEYQPLEKRRYIVRFGYLF